MEGTIKTLTEKGFGFITVDGEEKDLKSCKKATEYLLKKLTLPKDQTL
jgi:hypothetical protein